MSDVLATNKLHLRCYFLCLGWRQTSRRHHVGSLPGTVRPVLGKSGREEPRCVSVWPAERWRLDEHYDPNFNPTKQTQKKKNEPRPSKPLPRKQQQQHQRGRLGTEIPIDTDTDRPTHTHTQTHSLIECTRPAVNITNKPSERGRTVNLRPHSSNTRTWHEKKRTCTPKPRNRANGCFRQPKRYQ